MFKDSDLWPVQCPNCGDETKKEIGWLKQNRRCTCGSCGAQLWHHPETFIDMLQDMKGATEDVIRRAVTLKKET